MDDLNQEFRAGNKSSFPDDFNVPSETKIYYSKLSLSLMPGIMISIGISLLIIDNFFGLAFIAIGIVYLIGSFTKLIYNQPIITVNEKVIKIKDKEYPWKQISSERAAYEGWTVTQTESYLTFEAGNETLTVDIKDATISPELLGYLLSVYRSRSGQPPADKPVSATQTNKSKRTSWLGVAGRIVGKLLK